MSVISANNDSSSVYRQGNGVHDVLGRWMLFRQITILLPFIDKEMAFTMSSADSANNHSSVYGRQVDGTWGQIFGQGVHDDHGRWALFRQMTRICWRKRDNLKERKKALKYNFTAADPPPHFFTRPFYVVLGGYLINLPLQLSIRTFKSRSHRFSEK